MSLSSIPRAVRLQVFRRDMGQCKYCHLIQFGQASVFHINHIVPRSKGGRTELENLALQCPHCSVHKSDLLMAADPSTGDVTIIFHPIQQRWEDHFQLDRNGICLGTSPCGRATVEALQMNDSLPRLARALQISLGLIQV